MRIPPLLGAILLSLSGMAQSNVLLNYDAITRFDWNLFQGKINPRLVAEMGDNTGAVTVSSISYTAKQTSPHSVTIVIHARFHVNESWTKFPKLPDPDGALNHEKRHLDLTEIYARQLRKTVFESSFTAGNFKSELDRMFQEIVNVHREEQIRYDVESDHSNNPHQQEIWNIAIDRTLQELDDFSHTMLIVELK